MTNQDRKNAFEGTSRPHAERREGYVSHNHQVARELAAAGVPVFPASAKLNPKKLPELQPAKNPFMVTSWPKEATTESAVIDHWWCKEPDALVAMPAKQTGLFIVDADRHPGEPDGLTAFEALIAKNGGLPQGTVVVDTQCNGRHYIFKQPKGLLLGNSRGGLPPGVDTRGASGDGGYIIAPGTSWVAPNGDTRHWKEVEGTEKFIGAFINQSIPVVPDWIIEIIKGTKQAESYSGNPRSDGKEDIERKQSQDKRSFADWFSEKRILDEKQRVMEALSGLDACDRQKWITYGASIYDRFGETGRPIWDRWSETCPDKYDPVNQEKAWKSFGRGYSGKRATIASIFYDAKKEGFKQSGGCRGHNRHGEKQGDKGADEFVSDSTETFSSEESATGGHFEERTNESRPTIEIFGGGLSEAATQAEEALLISEIEIFQRGSELVYPCEDEIRSFRGTTMKNMRLERFTEARMTDALCMGASFIRNDKHIDPPANLAKIILARKGQWIFPRISGVTSSPIIKSDGTVISLEGYDQETGLYLGGLPEIPKMPIIPSREDAEAALNLLCSLLTEFPFIDDASRAAALSAIISPTVRSLLQTVPMHVASAPTPGSGKSYLIDLVSLVATGERAPATAYAKSPDENEKRIDGALLDGHPIFSFDNVNGDLSGDKLCQAVERPIIDVRRLGSSDKQKIENRMTLYGTGNNITPRGDMTRRTILIRLDARLERPENRKFENRPDQLICARRGDFIAACITIVRAYILAGKPNLLQSLPSFEDWSDYVRSALVWLGCSDPVDTMKALLDDDPEHQARILTFRGLHDTFGARPVTVKQMLSAAQMMQRGDPDDDFGTIHRSETPRHPELLDGLLEVAGKNDSISADLLGKWLRTNKGRIAGGFQLNRSARSEPAKWFVTSSG